MKVCMFLGSFRRDRTCNRRERPVLGKTVHEEAQDIKDQLGGELKSTTQEVQCLEKAVREEGRDIKDELERVHQSIERLSCSAHSSLTSLAPLMKGQYKIASLFANFSDRGLLIV